MDQSLGAQCRVLHTNTGKTATTLSDLLASHPDAREQLAAVQRELVDLQTASGLLADEASEAEQGEGTTPPVPDQLRTKIKLVPVSCEEVLGRLDQTLRRPGQDGSTGQQLADTIGLVAAFARPIENCRRAMRLAVDAFAMAPSLHRAAENDDAPPYGASQMLQEIQFLKSRLSETAGTSPLQIVILSEFLEQLRDFAQQQSGSLLLPGAPATTATTASLSPLLSPSSIGGASGDATSIRLSIASDRSPSYSFSGHELLPRVSPQNIELRHLKKTALGPKEPWEVGFAPDPHSTVVAVSTFLQDITLYDVAEARSQRPNSGTAYASGIHMMFSPGRRLMAVVTENERSDIYSGSHSDGVWHNGVDFRRPVLYVYEYGRARKLITLRWQGVKPLAFSPDGRTLAVAAPRGRIKLVDCGMPRLEDRLLCCHSDAVTHAVYTPDGAALVSLSLDGTIRVTEPQTGTSLGKLEVDPLRGAPMSLSVAPDGDLIVCIWGSNVTLWDRATGALDAYNLGAVRPCEGWPLAVSPDCRWLACRIDDGIDVSDLRTGTILFTFRFLKGFATAAAFSADGRYLAVTKFVSGKHTHAVGQAQLDTWEIVSLAPAA